MDAPKPLTVEISPYVATAIIEHGKRRAVAAGYIMGERTPTEIRVLDFFPLTHVGSLADVTSAEYQRERQSRNHLKAAFTTLTVLGWYSAGACPDVNTPEQFRHWCENPAHSFKGRVAVHVHCDLPDKGRLSVGWSAALNSISTEILPVEESSPAGRGPASKAPKTKEVVRTVRVAQLPVAVSALGHQATNVVLDHVASMVLYGGKKAYQTSSLLNLDRIAFETAKIPTPPLPKDQQQQQQGKDARDLRDEPLPARPMEAALDAIHDRFSAAVRQAKAAAAASGGGGAAAATGSARELLENLEAIKAVRVAEIESTTSSSREDSNTQRFKDAIMIKCMALMLRREVHQIEYLARQYNDPQAQGQQGQQGQGGHYNKEGGGGGGGGGGNFGNRNSNENRNARSGFANRNVG